MGRRHVHVIVVPKSVTWWLLASLTALMAGLIYGLSGKAYASADWLVVDLAARTAGSGELPSPDAVLAALMPVIGNALLFVPWGFLAFMALDSPRRTRRAAYLLTLAGALLFAGAMHAWQQFLPTRVTSLADAVANALGAVAGAAMAQARRDVHVRFEI